MEEGPIKGVIGPNGAGKTTIFNLITGVYTPTRGEIQSWGSDRRPQARRDGERGITRTFQNIRLFNHLSVLENVVIALDLQADLPPAHRPGAPAPGVAQGEGAAQQAMEYLDKVGLADRAHAQADSLPYGLQRKLEIARALALEPRLLLLDEPAAGMNPEESLGLARLIRESTRNSS